MRQVVGPTRWILIGLALASVEVASAQLMPLGDSFDVSDAEGASSPRVEALSSGGFVVVWSDGWPAGRLFDATGLAQGGDFVAGSSQGYRRDHRLAAYSGDRFVLTWGGSSSFQEPRCVGLQRIRDGFPFGDLPQVCEENPRHPAVAAFPDGGLVLGWGGWQPELGFTEVRAQVFAADDSPGGSFGVSASDGSTVPVLADLGAWQDGFIVIWRDKPPGNVSANLMGRRYRRSGEALGGPFPISGDIDPFTTSAVDGRVAVNRGGRSVVVWSERIEPAANARKVRARIYDQSGDSLGPAFDLYRPAAGESAFDPSVAIDSAGNFVVVWRGAGCADPCVGTRLKGQLFDRRGEPRGPVIEIGEGIGSPTVALSDNGLVFATYRGEDLIQGRLYDAGTDASCMPDERTLCLNDGRFRVQIDWEKPNGETGIGRVVPAMSSDTGIFWFFNSANWELLVKVLNGCERTGHYWVFSAATTNVRYELTVTDMLTQQQRTYVNPQGIAAAAVTDTAAFATCP